MGEVPASTTFYQFLKSDEGPEKNTAGNFLNYVPAKQFDNSDDWEVGISSITCPDSFFNITGTMKNITLGNNSCEFNFSIPAGKYTPEKFVTVMNKIVRRKVMPWKYEVLPGWKVPIGASQLNAEDGPKTFEKIKTDLGETNQPLSSFFNSDEEKEAYKGLFEGDTEIREEEDEWTFPEDAETDTDTYMIPPDSQVEEFKKLVKYYCTAARLGKVVNFRQLDDENENAEFKGDRPVLRTITKHHLADFSEFLIHFSKTLHKDHGANIAEFLRSSKLHFYYDKFYNKIGVKSIFKKNPFGDYVVFHHPQLRNMLGVSSTDAKKLLNSGQNGWLAKKGYRTFKHVCNFELGFENIFVYCNIVVESGIGNKKSQITEILSVPPIRPDKKSQLSFRFPEPNFKTLDRCSVNAIELFLADVQGKEIKFHDCGVTIVSLKFRKKTPITSVLEKIYQEVKKGVSYIDM